MDKQKNNITATVIATIISLIAIVGFASSFISNQAKLEVQLSNIQKELAEINAKLDMSGEKIELLTERVIILEQRSNK